MKQTLSGVSVGRKIVALRLGLVSDVGPTTIIGRFNIIAQSKTSPFPAHFHICPACSAGSLLVST